MNKISSAVPPESRGATYLKASAFGLPALFVWIFSCVFIFPKLKQLMADAGMLQSHADANELLAVARSFLQLSDFVQEHIYAMVGVALFMAVLFEWRQRAWPRYRRAVVGVAVFLLNSTVLVGMTLMLISALLVAPAVMRH